MGSYNSLSLIDIHHLIYNLQKIRIKRHWHIRQCFLILIVNVHLTLMTIPRARLPGIYYPIYWLLLQSQFFYSAKLKELIFQTTLFPSFEELQMWIFVFPALRNTAWRFQYSSKIGNCVRGRGIPIKKHRFYYYLFTRWHVELSGIHWWFTSRKTDICCAFKFNKYTNN